MNIERKVKRVLGIVVVMFLFCSCSPQDVERSRGRKVFETSQFGKFFEKLVVYEDGSVCLVPRQGTKGNVYFIIHRTLTGASEVWIERVEKDEAEERIITREIEKEYEKYKKPNL